MTAYFITGGFGFLGQYIVKAIHDHDPDAELRVLVRTDRSTYLHLEKLDRVHWISGDLTNLESFADQLKGVDTVIHNAALVSFRKSDADAIFQSNVIGTHNLAQAALEAGCRNFIFISSISAIGAEPPKVSDERMMPDLDFKRRTDMYGYSKLCGEIELKKYTEQMRVIILNPSVVIGPGSDRIGMIARTLKFMPVMPMLSYRNSFVDVRDIAHAVVLAITKGRNGERYIVTAWNMGMLEFTQACLRVMNKKAWIIPLSGAGVRVMDGFLWLLDLVKLNPGIRRLSEIKIDKSYSWKKIKDEMDWEPEFSLEQSITDSFLRSKNDQTRITKGL
jgi:nucleoside-diphosphate-sugar epimerase